MNASQSNWHKLSRAVVVHAGNRGRYQVALALHEAGLLEKLVTDIYFPLDKPWFTRTFGRLLPIEWLSKRYCPGLPSDKVCSTAKALGVIAANRMLRGRWNLYPVSDAILGKTAFGVARRAKANILSYCTYAYSAFGQSQDKQVNILFTQQAHPISVYDEAIKYANEFPEDRLIVFKNVATYIPPAQTIHLVAESVLADAIISPSDACRISYVTNGFRRASFVIPYGVHQVQSEDYQLLVDKSPERIKFAFVGKFLPLKGVGILLRAWKSVPKTHRGELHLFVSASGELNHYKQLDLLGDDVYVHIGIHGKLLWEHLRKCDVFVFPSLTEGLAMVILEAMSCGLPVITTPPCGPDVIVEGEHGFIVPIRDPQALADRIVWCLGHQERLAEMGHQAAIRAREFTWERFRHSLREAYSSICACQTSVSEKTLV